MPTAEYKQQGDADPCWCGEGGEPGGPPLNLYIREPILEHPNPLPPVQWVTDQQKEDLSLIFNSGHMSEQEVQLMREYMLTYKFTNIRREGKYGQDGLPGYPASIGPVEDKQGHACVAKNIRVLDEITPDVGLFPVQGSRQGSIGINSLRPKVSDCPNTSSISASPHPSIPKHILARVL
eukprot:g67859.t1